MATKLKNLSSANLKPIPMFKKLTVAIVVAEWNPAVTFALRDGAVSFLKEMGLKDKNIIVEYVPGSFELPLGAQLLASKVEVDAVIALGCVIQGETRHFDFICDAVAHGIMDVSLTFNMPVAFGVLTTQNLKQAKERAGGKHGNKGVEAAETILKMLALQAKV